ncbi:MAG TPA: DNA primase [Ferruginibacter sp.]|nr:DNA primase [Ferruginibacter sp.]
MISQHTIQQIQSRIDIIDIVGTFVKLKKRGTNYLGLCPFHNEKTPSFTVSPTKEIYKCFGCGKSGNSISFLMDHEKYSYVEALRWLANRYNVEVEETAVSPEVKLQQQVADSLYILNDYASKFFIQQLHETEDGTDIGLSYLKERGFSDHIIEKFQLGYAPRGGQTFSTTAIADQYNPELLLKSGLSTDRNGSIADNYRNRIVFPIHNQSGKVVGFGARVIGQADKSPKYINTPENEIYIKSRILYGSFFARQAIDRKDECLLVEGYTDVISLHQAGIENVVASGGTALTPDQLRLIKKYTNNLTILYDGDSAGVKAALRGLDLALEEGLNVKLALIPDGEDPDSYVRKIGEVAFNKFVETHKQDFVLFQLEVALKDAGKDSQKKSVVVHQIAETLSKMNRPEDFIRRQDYITLVSQRLRINEDGLIELINKQVREKINKPHQGSKVFQEAPGLEIPGSDSVASPETIHLLDEDERQEQAVIRALLDFGLKMYHSETVADFIFRELEENELTFNNQALENILRKYKEMYASGLEPTVKDFLYLEDRDISSLVIQVMEVQTEISPRWQEMYNEKIPTREDMYMNEMETSIIYFKLRKVKRLILENQKEMEEAPEEELLERVAIHQQLKQAEMQLTRSLGTVILK